MKAAIFVKPGEVAVKEVPDPKICKPTDAIVKIIRSCVCGSDLWYYRGLMPHADNSFTTGHEALGIVKEVGSEVQNVKPGDFVICPFTHGCGHCIACVSGFDGNCLNRTDEDPQDWGGSYQAELLRFINADWALVKVPGFPADYDDETLNSLLTLSDVMATGYHAAVSAEVKPDSTAVVVGDGAVGLCGVISCRLLGATRIIAMSSHEDRQKMALEFGATDIISERGEEAIEHLKEINDGHKADSALECVGTNLSLKTCLGSIRPGGVVGRVGLPEAYEVDAQKLFEGNYGLKGGIAAVTTYDRPYLLTQVLEKKINPGKVFTKSFKFDDIQKAYEAMDKREVIKSLLIMD